MCGYLLLMSLQRHLRRLTKRFLNFGSSELTHTVLMCTLQVRRGQHLVHDTLLQIQNAGLNVRKPLKVQFHGEEGVDEGGVQKVGLLRQHTVQHPCIPASFLALHMTSPTRSCRAV